jgi:hypothetical protein
VTGPPDPCERCMERMHRWPFRVSMGRETPDRPGEVLCDACWGKLERADRVETRCDHCGVGNAQWSDTLGATICDRCFRKPFYGRRTKDGE